MEDIIAQARELGKKIAAHARTQEFIAAAKAVSEDREAQTILKAYQDQSEKLRDLQAQRKPIEPDDKRRLADAETGVATNEKLKKMMKHQADYMEMMHRINSAIDEASQAANE